MMMMMMMMMMTMGIMVTMMAMMMLMMVSHWLTSLDYRPWSPNRLLDCSIHRLHSRVTHDDPSPVALSGRVRQQGDFHVVETEAACVPEASPVAVVVAVNAGSASIVADLTKYGNNSKRRQTGRQTGRHTVTAATRRTMNGARENYQSAAHLAAPITTMKTSTHGINTLRKRSRAARLLF